MWLCNLHSTQGLPWHQVPFHVPFPWYMTFAHVLSVPCVWSTLRLCEHISMPCNIYHSLVNQSCLSLTHTILLTICYPIETQITFLSNISQHLSVSFYQRSHSCNQATTYNTCSLHVFAHPFVTHYNTKSVLFPSSACPLHKNSTFSWISHW